MALLALLSLHVPALVVEPRQQRFAWLDAGLFDQPVTIDSGMNVPLKQIDLLAIASAIRHFARRRCRLTNREFAAIRLLFASFCQPFIELVFILRFMAIEALLERRERPEAVLELVEAAIEAANNATNIEVGAQRSVVFALKGLRYESVGSAGRRLARERLSHCEYHELPAAKFFRRCYDIRNLLLHGSFEGLDQQQIWQLATELGAFVPELIIRRHDA